MAKPTKQPKGLKNDTNEGQENFKLPEFSAAIDSRINERLEKKMNSTVDTIKRQKTVRSYLLHHVENKLAPNKEIFLPINALFTQIENGINSQDIKKDKLNVHQYLNKTIISEESREESLLKSTSFYSKWTTPVKQSAIANKLEKLVFSNKQHKAETFVKKTKFNFNEVIKTINLKKENINQTQKLNESRVIDKKNKMKQVLLEHKRAEIKKHLSKLKKQKRKRIKVLRKANKKYNELKEKIPLYKKMETVYSARVEKTIKNENKERKKLFEPWDYSKLKEHEEIVVESYKKRTLHHKSPKKLKPSKSVSLKRVELINRQKHFSKIVQKNNRPSLIPENSIKIKLEKEQQMKETQRNEFLDKIKENIEKSKNYLKESLLYADYTKSSNKAILEEKPINTKTNYLPMISQSLPKKKAISLKKIMAKDVNDSNLPSIMSKMNKYESVNKSKLQEMGKDNGFISKKKIEKKQKFYSGMIDAKLALLDKLED